MDLGPALRRPRAESIVPMINVVFLLLIFFLMTAQIRAPEPFELVVPQSDDGAPADVAATIFVSESGALAFEDARGEDAVFRALSNLGPLDIVHIRADQRSDAAVVARVLRRLPELGVTSAQLVTARQ